MVRKLLLQLIILKLIHLSQLIFLSFKIVIKITLSTNIFKTKLVEKYLFEKFAIQIMLLHILQYLNSISFYNICYFCTKVFKSFSWSTWKRLLYIAGLIMQNFRAYLWRQRWNLVFVRSYVVRNTAEIIGHNSLNFRRKYVINSDLTSIMFLYNVPWKHKTNFGKM